MTCPNSNVEVGNTQQTDSDDSIKTIQSSIPNKFTLNKTYKINLEKIENNVLFYKFQDEVYCYKLCPIELCGELYQNADLNDQEDHLTLFVNPFCGSKYLSSKNYILEHDNLRIFSYLKSRHKVNVPGLYNIIIDNIELKPIRSVYSQRGDKLTSLPYPGIKVNYHFVDNVAKQDCLYLALSDKDHYSKVFNINAVKVNNDIMRFEFLLTNNRSLGKFLKYFKEIFNTSTDSLKQLISDINDTIVKDTISSYLIVRLNDNNQIIYNLPINNWSIKGQTYRLDLFSPFSNPKHKPSQDGENP